MKFHNCNVEECSSDFSKSSLKEYLNGDFYNSLSFRAQNQIEESLFYLGKVDYSQEPSTEQTYYDERSTKANFSEMFWTVKVALMYISDQFMVLGKGVEPICYSKPTYCGFTWFPQYVNSNPNAGWIYNSNILEESLNIYKVWTLTQYDHGNLLLGSAAISYDVESADYGVRPVVYLKSSVKITKGTGEESNPYKLSI